MNSQEFDYILTSPYPFKKPPFHNIAELIYKKSPYREENQSNILQTQHNNKTLTISLRHYRYLTTKILEDLEKLNIQKNQTVLLATFSSNSVLHTALLFTALIARGNRVFLPMFVETNQLNRWLKTTHCQAAIIPETEIIEGNNKEEKHIIEKIRSTLEKQHIPLYDTIKDFSFQQYLTDPPKKSQSYLKHKFVQEAIQKTSPSNEAAIFTTSGTTGISKLVVYTQKGFLNNCASWQASNAYDCDKTGGKTFIDILPHTISIRAYFNAIWTGKPLCFVTSDSIKKTPEKILPHLAEIKPEVLNLGPSSFKVICEFIQTFPEIKDLVFSKLHTILSIGAPYSPTIAQHCKETFTLTLHNGFGTTETQLVCSTILQTQPPDIKNMSIGVPYAGVKIGLKHFENALYLLYINTPYGHAFTLQHQTGKKHKSTPYYKTGDLVRYHDGQLYYHGREEKDYIKNGYGAKIPLSLMEQRYKELYKFAQHIEYYPYEINTYSFGIAAMIFLKSDNLAKGPVQDKKTKKHFEKLIKSLNKQLKKTLEPFEHEQQSITRFLLINDLPKTAKGTISRYKIHTKYANELDYLKHDKIDNHGVVETQSIDMKLKSLLLNLPILKITLFRTLLLKIFLRKNNNKTGESQ